MNVYNVFLRASIVRYSILMLYDTEEDLAETRKIARSNIETAGRPAACFLPFSYIQVATSQHSEEIAFARSRSAKVRFKHSSKIKM